MKSPWALPSPAAYRSFMLRLIVLFLLAGGLLRANAQNCDYTVTSLADSGAGTLRTGLADPAVTSICFSVQGTITLATPLQIYNPVTINDNGAITISGNNQVQIFYVSLATPMVRGAAGKTTPAPRPNVTPTPLATSVVRINGLTLTNGNATYGGAIQVASGELDLVSTNLTNNTASDGGAIYSESTVSLTGTAFTGNTASLYTGGAIDNSFGTLTIQDGAFTNNSSAHGSGGAIYNTGSVQITRGFFTGNTGTSGGAIYSEYYGTLNLSGGLSFTSNVASTSGGAISSAGTATVSQALFQDNQVKTTADVTPEGGAFYNTGTATISSCTFTLNSSSQQGGAITDAGGSLTLVNDTIVNNTAATSGSGVQISSSGGVTISNTIVANNAAIPGLADPDCTGCESSTGSNNLIGVNPYLGPLAFNGGTANTLMPLPGGPAVGGGSPTAVIDSVDERGLSRLAGNGSVDIGAVQSHYSSVTFLSPPSNTYVNTAFSPQVSVQVVERDGNTTNYPLGVPVTVSLFTSQGTQAYSNLTGTLTQQPIEFSGQAVADFPDLAVNATGSYEMQATIVPVPSSASQDPAYGTMSGIFQVTEPTVVTLNWQPAPLTYGPLPASELNASATINGQPSTGTFVYTFVSDGSTITVGQVYPVGSYRVQVVYTPTNSTNQYTLQTSLNIAKATPTLTWPTPAPIYTTTPLSGTQLNSTAAGVNGAALPGSFVYTPPAGTTLTAGSHTLAVAFTPTDTANYTNANAQVSIQVNTPGAASVTVQDSANPITFGQSETFTATVKASDGSLYTGGTATFSVDGVGIGSAAVVSGSASVSTATIRGGTHQVTVTYTNTAPVQTLTGSTSLTVNRATPLLTWATPAPIYTSTPLSGSQLNAVATGIGGVALPGIFVYVPAAGTTLAAGPHTLSTTFTPTDATDYATATAQVSIQVNAPTASTVVLQESANPITYGQSVTLSALVTGSDGKPLSGGNAVFTSDGTSIGSVAVANGTGSVIAKGLTAGTHNLAVTYTNTATQQTLTNTATLTVNKATPVLNWPVPAAIFTSTPLSPTQLDAAATGAGGATLPGTFTYTPSAGTTLTAGPHVLSTSFTPTDALDYNTATAQVTIQVNTPTASTVVVQESANPITYGQNVTLTALVTGSDGKPLSGGTAAFAADGVSLGSADLTNGVATLLAKGIAAGTHTIAVLYSNTSPSQQLTGTATLTVNKATPVIQWPVPAPITVGTALSSAQLDATATGVNGAGLPGAFTYSPAAGTKPPAGSQTLSVTFAPADNKDYNNATAQVSLAVGFVPITLTSLNPTNLPLSTSAALIQVNGTGFTSTSVVQVGGVAVATTVQNSTTITATIPGKSLTSPGKLTIAVYDSTSKLTSNALTLTVAAEMASATVSVPATVTSGEQPGISINLSTPYPLDLAGTLSLNFTPTGSEIDDPAVQFSTGGRSVAFTIPAGTTASPQFALQTGTVAGTITVSLVLTANGVDVTPAGVSPFTLVIAPAAPVITSVSFSNTGNGLITVVVNGFSNTREMTQADFDFTGSGAHALSKSGVTLPVGTLFTPWYGAAASDQYGSAFTYTQNFQLSSPDPSITGVTVTLTNSVGTSGSVNSQ